MLEAAATDAIKNLREIRNRLLIQLDDHIKETYPDLISGEVSISTEMIDVLARRIFQEWGPVISDGQETHWQTICRAGEDSWEVLQYAADHICRYEEDLFGPEAIDMRITDTKFTWRGKFTEGRFIEITREGLNSFILKYNTGTGLPSKFFNQLGVYIAALPRDAFLLYKYDRASACLKNMIDAVGAAILSVDDAYTPKPEGIGNPTPKPEGIGNFRDQTPSLGEEFINSFITEKGPDINP